MTVTAPLATPGDLIIGDNLPVIIPDEPMIDSGADVYSILHDPIVPFLVIGLATFLALVVAAFVLSGPIV